MKKATFLLATLFFAATALFAQGDHKHGSPHGGEVKSAGAGFHIEVLVKGVNLTVYLLDGNEKPMSIAGAAAKALVQTADGKTSTIILKANGTASFGYKLNATKKIAKAIVTIKKGGKTASASFDLVKKNAAHSDAHHH